MGRVSDPHQDAVQQCVNVLLERHGLLLLVVKRQEDRALRATLGDVLVLSLLGVGEVIILLEDALGVLEVRLGAPRLDEPEAAARDVDEADVEATELSTDHEEDGKWRGGEVVLGDKVRVEPEGQG